eukprot:scaffold45272_cov153-Skeletonema_marinoi.AAC.1
MEPYDLTLPFGIVRTTSYTRLWNAVGGLSIILLATSRDGPTLLLLDLCSTLDSRSRSDE